MIYVRVEGKKGSVYRVKNGRNLHLLRARLKVGIGNNNGFEYTQV